MSFKNSLINWAFLIFLKNLVPVRESESDLFKAMKQISLTGQGPETQIPSAGCGIKWKNN